MKFSYSHHKRVFIGLLYIFIICLYLPFIYSNIVIILLLILSFFFLAYEKYNIPKAKIYFLSSLILYFFVYFIALFYTENLRTGLFTLEKRLPFIAFPIIFLPFSFSKETLQKIIRFYITVSFIVCLWLLALVMYKLLNNPEVGFSTFTNHELSRLVGFHATYLAMYIGFAFLLCLLALQKERAGKAESLKYSVIAVTFLLIEILLFARIVIVALSVIAGAIIIFSILKQKKYKLILPLIGFTVIASLITFSVPTLKERFKEAINYNSEYTIDKQWGGRSMRLLKWNCCVQIIEENWLIGVSPGDAQDVLDKCYRDNKFAPLYHWPNIRFNAHNQYLQELINVGLLGFLPFIGSLLAQGYFASRKREFSHLLFLSLFSIICITESILGLNKGIVFFTFFSCLFSSYYFDVTYHKT